MFGGERHVSFALEGPGGEILHVVQQAGLDHGFIQPAILRPIFKRGLHRLPRLVLLLREKRLTESKERGHR
jgi:hypothetical protein